LRFEAALKLRKTAENKKTMYRLRQLEQKLNLLQIQLDIYRFRCL